MKSIILIGLLSFFSLVVVAQQPNLKTDTAIYVIVQKQQYDSLKTALFLANYKLTRVNYYLNICLKRPSQTKFLAGWIKRAIQ